MVDEITFQHWFVSVKQDIPEYMIKTINPYNMKFLKSDNVYFAISFVNSETVEVCSTIGTGITGFREFLESVRSNGIKTLTFGCSENNRVTQVLYKYAGAKKILEIPKYYSDGNTCYRYELDLVNSKRLNREKI